MEELLADRACAINLMDKFNNLKQWQRKPLNTKAHTISQRIQQEQRLSLWYSGIQYVHCVMH